MRRSPLSVLFFTVFLDLIGFGLIIPMLPFYAQRFGAGSFEVALLSASYSAMQFLFVPIWGELSDRIGRRPVLLTSILGTSGSMALLAVADSYPALLLTRVLQGIATANFATAQAYVADVTAPEDRARGMGLIGAALGLGFILGPFMGGVLASYSPVLPGLVAAGLSLLNFVLALRNLPESRPADVPRSAFSYTIALRALGRQLTFAPLREAAASTGVLLLVGVYFLHTLSFTNLESTFALFLCHRFGFAERGTGYMLGYVGVIVALIQGRFLGPLVRRFGEVKLVRAGFVMLAAGMVALALLPRLAVLGPAPAVPSAAAAQCVGSVAASTFVTRAGPLWLILVLIAAGNALVNPGISTLTSQAAPRERQGGTLGVQQAAGSLARVVGPLVGGFAFDAVGPAAPYWLAGAGMLLALSGALRLVQGARR
jgi:MFS family permease